MSTVSLIVRKKIAATRDRLFRAWTDATQVLAWWGPKGVRCTHAEVDARVGGRYRIGNAMPDGRVLWISGEFLEVEEPAKLVYTWRIDDGDVEMVTVRFEDCGSETEVVVMHERIASEALRDGHAVGWEGCLEGLAAVV